MQHQSHVPQPYSLIPYSLTFCKKSIETPTSPAQAVVTEVRENMAQVWLGGVDLRKVNPSMVLTGIDGKGKVRVRSRNGLVAQTNIEEEVQEGALLEVR
ncbi:hypothetical protein PN466_08615 [Roseofilum reptotaenium CS-1145]|uniref:hypothetical protein n=1 Tax=Roseofilum reptotaenium TaxID=1233427 RepID=UPI000B14212B|nr:hypothetical protein [Roseofilum reptotaenium]MDB9517009.1 hypothetical protein [Roseofilum reptotaenium CS-1145]